MGINQVIFVRCELIRGGFPNHRNFFIHLDAGEEFRGVAQSQYCFTLNRNPLGDSPPPGERMDGLVLGMIIDQPDDNSYRVQLPDGFIYDLSRDQMEFIHAERESQACI